MRRKGLWFFFVGLMALLLLAACQQQSGGQEGTVKEIVKTVVVTVEVPAEGAGEAGPAVPQGYGATLKAVQERGYLICGVNAKVPGFGFLNEQGEYQGFDIDFCRAVAAAIFGDPTKVEFRPLSAKERFTALQTGEIDVLIRNTTWTLTRDTEVGANFVHTTFYDGQGFIVRKDSGIETLEDLEGAAICVQTGTTTETNLRDVLDAHGIEAEVVVYDDVEAGWAAYEEGRCDAYTTDKSGLVARRTLLKNPEEHVILDVTVSKEPLGPVVRHGDDQWFDIVQWTVFATFYAEEAGVTSQNVDQVKAETKNPRVRSMLGLEGDLGKKLGLSNDWAYNIIKHVGNYEEIYNRNLGPDTPTYIPRGLNKLYTEGGLLYSPPFK